jgi:hypothetical protein
MAASSVGAPAASQDQNQQVMVKLGQRVTAAIHKYKVHDKPIPVRCSEIGVSVCNRNKSIPNMTYVHKTLYRNISSDSFDPDRLLPGICIQYENKDPLNNLKTRCTPNKQR